MRRRRRVAGNVLDSGAEILGGGGFRGASGRRSHLRRRPRWHVGQTWSCDDELRLGPLGFLAIGLTQENDPPSSGNYGILDQMRGCSG